MRRLKAGFTLIELVVTLAVLGVLVTMTSVTIGVMVNLQSSVGNTASTSEQIDRASEMIGEYVALISVDTRAKSDGSIATSTPTDRYFEYSTGSKYEITFLCNGIDEYKLSFSQEQHKLSIVSPAYSDNKVFSQLDSIEFKYDSAIALLVADLKPSSGTPITRAYSLEVLR